MYLLVLLFVQNDACIWHIFSIFRLRHVPSHLTVMSDRKRKAWPRHVTKYDISSDISTNSEESNNFYLIPCIPKSAQQNK